MRLLDAAPAVATAIHAGRRVTPTASTFTSPGSLFGETSMPKLPAVTGANTMSNSFLGDNIQICVVTRDFRRTMEGLTRTGIGPWRVYTFSPETVREQTFRGKPGNYAMKLGLAWSGTMNWEIVQPLSGENIYQEFLDTHGEGIHHVAFGCNSVPYAERIRGFEARGYKMIQSGLWLGKLPYHYFGTEGDTTTIFEIFQPPDGFEFPEPEEWYPAPPPKP
jgi:methylmalonyl-CoA/ethylmalonyl-CoA epimerase